MTAHRILVIAHAHPDFSKGGGEIAAHNLFRAYRETPGVEAAWFLARADLGRGAVGHIALRHRDEYLWEQATPDIFTMRSANRFEVLGYFAELLRALRPTVVHLHHYLHLGLDLLRVIRQVDPGIRIVVTLHEYMAICLQNGQMVKRGSFRLCHGADYEDCHRCFPERTPEEFWLRRQRFMRAFDLVDQFVAPSHFLRERYIAWGLDPARIAVIENGQSDCAALPPRVLAPGETRNRFAFFGQVNPFKGVSVLLRALAALPKPGRRSVRLEIHGANLETQTQDFRDEIAALRKPLEKAGVLDWIGPYEAEQLPARMAGIDWVVVPSVWWENSPMVIQEAFALGRPVVTSDIGGMAEKVQDGVNGRHVQAGNVGAWSAALAELAQASGEWDALRAGIAPPPSHAECAAAHLDLLSAPVSSETTA